MTGVCTAFEVSTVAFQAVDATLFGIHTVWDDLHQDIGLDYDIYCRRGREGRHHREGRWCGRGARRDGVLFARLYVSRGSGHRRRVDLAFLGAGAASRGVRPRVDALLLAQPTLRQRASHWCTTSFGRTHANATDR